MSYLSGFTSNCRRIAGPGSPSPAGKGRYGRSPSCPQARQCQSRLGTRRLHSHNPLNPCKQTSAVLARDPRLDARPGRQATFPVPCHTTLHFHPGHPPRCHAASSSPPTPIGRPSAEPPYSGLRMGFRSQSTYLPRPRRAIHPRSPANTEAAALRQPAL